METIGTMAILIEPEIFQHSAALDRQGMADQKPDIAAPGQGIVAALSSNVDTTGDASNIVTS